MDQHPLGDGQDLEDGPTPGDPAPTTSVGRRVRPTVGRVGRSLPGAIVGVLLVSAIALGASARMTALGGGGSDGAPATQTADGGTTDDHGGDLGTAPGLETGDEPGSGADATDPAVEPGSGDATDGDATDGDATDGDAGTGDQPTTEPTPAPDTEPRTIAIALHLGDGKVRIEWGDCPLDGFAAWKVLRTLDGAPSWPLGDGDRLVAASENQALGSVLNGDLPAGKTLYYRVLGLVGRDGHVVIGCRSRIADIHIPAAEPTPAPTNEPDAIGSIGLTLTLTDGGKPWADWTACTGDWDYAKVIRSTNSTVTFPKGEGDALAGVTGKDGPTALTDGGAPAGKKLWYRVFCVRVVGDGYQVVAASPTRSITTPAAEPQPEPAPVSLDITAELTDGGVAIHWGTCSNDHFVAYKVIRSAGSNPSYLPATDGSVVVAVRESAAVTTFTDPNVEPGQTWHYRVQCIGWMNDHKILLGETDVVTVTLP
jgi:hypothetical protein